MSVGARTHWRLSPAKIPTGETEPIERLFANPQAVALKDYDLDDVFSDLVRDQAGRAVMSVKGKAQKIDVLFGRNWRSAVVWAPKPTPAAPDRQFICFEPMAGITDAMNLSQRGSVQRAPEHSARRDVAGELLDSANGVPMMRLNNVGRPFQGRQGGADSPALLAVVALLLACLQCFASGAQDLHPGDYPQADIGARLTDLRDAVFDLPSADRRRHRRRQPPFRKILKRVEGSGPRADHHDRHPSDRDAAVQVRRGRSLGRHRALSRNMNTFRSGVGEARRRGVAGGRSSKARADARPAIASNGKGPRVAPDLSDVGAVRSAGSLQRSLVRSQQPDDADQPSGARRARRTAKSSTAGG